MLLLQLRYDSYGVNNGAFIEHMKTSKLKSQTVIILPIKIFLVVIPLLLSSQAVLHGIRPTFVRVNHVV